MTIIKTFFVLLIFTSCSDTIDKNKLVGRYVMASDTIEILSNNTFRHIFNNKINRGTWTINPTSNEVAFSNFSFKSDSGYGVWYSRIIQVKNEIHLNIDSDKSDGYFNKIND